VIQLDEADDYLHDSTKHSDWRESWYFNWVDLDTQICGFSTIAILPNIPKREFVFAIFVDGLPRLHLAEPHGQIPLNFEKAVSNEQLTYTLVKPFKEWHINFENTRFAAKMHWQARFPAYDFGRGSSVTWGRHFEQSGIVEGEIRLSDGLRHSFKGLSQRDKSWGIRHWHIDKWFHMMAQFDDFMIGFRQDTIKGKDYISGCICSEKQAIPVIEVTVETEFEDDPIRKPICGFYEIIDATGTKYTLTSELISPLTFARYSRQFAKGETELFEQMVIYKYQEGNQTGAGLAEYVFSHSTPK
jgi:hypothetical protein